MLSALAVLGAVFLPMAVADFSFREFFAQDWALNVTEIDRSTGFVLESRDAGYALRRQGKHLVGTFFQGDLDGAPRSRAVVLFDDDNTGALYIGESPSDAGAEDFEFDVDAPGADDSGEGDAEPSVAGMRRVLPFAFSTTGADLHLSSGPYRDDTGSGIHQFFVPTRSSFVMVVEMDDGGPLLRVVGTHRAPQEPGFLSKYGPTLLIFGFLIVNNVIRTKLRDRKNRQFAAQRQRRQARVPQQQEPDAQGQVPPLQGGQEAGPASGAEGKKDQ